MRIAFLSPEVWPFTRVGGLAEVSHDLSRALAARGHQVDVVTVKQRLSADLEERLEPTPHEMEVPVSWRSHQCGAMRYALCDGVTVHLLSQDTLFNREGLYGNAYGEYEDNAERFILFSRCALELLIKLGEPVDVLHANDWTNGLVPLYLKTLYAHHPEFEHTASLMTVHNLGNQGMFWHYDMPLTGLGWEYFTPEAVEFFGKINFLKAGLVFADMVSTVSPSYLEEMLGPETGMGLEGILRGRKKTLAAVTNGVDYQAWGPDDDPALVAHFNRDNLEPKKLCKADLRLSFNLPAEEDRPLLVFVGRLVDRRGLDILIPALQGIFDLGFQVAVMGFGEDHYHETLSNMARSNPDRLGVHIGYDMLLAHKMMGGADMLIMPSRYEPCGLHQMHAMRYGTVPVVRSTGGLKDTVSEHSAETPGVGFRFDQYLPDAILQALEKALGFYQDRRQWHGIMKRCMAKDFSWESAAASYEKIYQQAIQIRREAGER